MLMPLVEVYARLQYAAIKNNLLRQALSLEIVNCLCESSALRADGEALLGVV